MYDFAIMKPPNFSIQSRRCWVIVKHVGVHGDAKTITLQTHDGRHFTFPNPESHERGYKTTDFQGSVGKGSEGEDEHPTMLPQVIIFVQNSTLDVYIIHKNYLGNTIACKICTLIFDEYDCVMGFCDEESGEYQYHLGREALLEEKNVISFADDENVEPCEEDDIYKFKTNDSNSIIETIPPQILAEAIARLMAFPNGFVVNTPLLDDEQGYSTEMVILPSAPSVFPDRMSLCEEVRMVRAAQKFRGLTEEKKECEEVYKPPGPKNFEVSMCDLYSYISEMKTALIAADLCASALMPPKALKENTPRVKSSEFVNYMIQKGEFDDVKYPHFAYLLYYCTTGTDVMDGDSAIVLYKQAESITREIRLHENEEPSDFENLLKETEKGKVPESFKQFLVGKFIVPDNEEDNEEYKKAMESGNTLAYFMEKMPDDAAIVPFTAPTPKRKRSDDIHGDDPEPSSKSPRVE